MHILTAILRLQYWPKSLNTAQIIMIHKPGKNTTDVSSYRPISLLPTISKLPEKLILKNINKDLNPQKWIPNHQFGFRQAHSTVQQCHRISDVFNKAMENQQYCTAAFLDVNQQMPLFCLYVREIKQNVPDGLQPHCKRTFNRRYRPNSWITYIYTERQHLKGSYNKTNEMH